MRHDISSIAAERSGDGCTELQAQSSEPRTYDLTENQEINESN